jgi:hypothetical protein|tara:strand:+ start:318 stop:551 length:234 start_codon:yes stop_codon:yes gene_type:complete
MTYGNQKEIQEIREVMWKLQNAFDKFSVCVDGHLRHSTDIEIARDMYPIAQELNSCIVSLATKTENTTFWKDQTNDD